MPRAAFPLRSHQVFPAGVLVLTLFLLGIYLGAVALPATALSRLYTLGSKSLMQTLPAATEPEPALTKEAKQWFAAAGLPAMARDTDAIPVTAASSQPILVLATEPENTETNTGPAEPVIADLAPRVMVYCTHASENYAGERRVNGKAGGVMEAAAALADELTAQGIGVLFDETIHDSPSYETSYESSLASIKAAIKENPTLEVFIDVHRDSMIEGVSTTLSGDRGSFARMMLVVGSDEKYEHPNWQQNYDFARAITAAANKIEVGIMREPRVYSNRYNQHVSPHAILVEIGSDANSKGEAVRAARILAQAVVSCLQ